MQSTRRTASSVLQTIQQFAWWSESKAPLATQIAKHQETALYPHDQVPPPAISQQLRPTHVRTTLESAAANHGLQVHHHYYSLQTCHHSPQRSILPFIGGAAVGALGLAAWQSVQADSHTHVTPNHLQLPFNANLQRQTEHQPAETVGHTFLQTSSLQGNNSYGSNNSSATYDPVTYLLQHQQQEAARQHPLQNVSWTWGPWQGRESKANDRGGGWRATPYSKQTSVKNAPPVASVTHDTPHNPSAASTHAKGGSVSNALLNNTISTADRPPLVSCHALARDTSAVMQSESLVSDVANGSNNAEKEYWQAPLTRGAISAASAAAAPAVVHILISDERETHAGPLARYRTSSGSGFVYDSSGYILTNAHVVAAAAATAVGQPSSHHHDGSCDALMGSPNSNNKRCSLQSGHVAGAGNPNTNTLTITMHDGRVLKGKVVAMDCASDIAVVKADLAAGESLPAVQAGRSTRLRVGEWVVAVGTPLMLKQSVTAGIVSCVERRGSELGLDDARCAYIQTDAAINQGNSGGPLVNLDGQVVGMSVFKAVAADGVSFAVPMDNVCEIVRQFHEHGRVIRPYVGVTMVEVTNGALKQLQQSIPQLAGATAAVMLEAVREGSPAQEAGLLPEDILLTLDGRSGFGMNEAVEAFGRAVGKPVACGIIRRLGPDRALTFLTLNVTPREAGR